MATTEPHTVKAFDEDLEQIRALVAEMGGLTEQAIERATETVATRDALAAAQIVADDKKIDAMAETIERQCVRLIALRAPMADDLRSILAAFKIAILVERVGDCARSIAEQVPLMQGFDQRLPKLILSEMSAKASEMIRRSLDAFVDQSAAAARSVCGDDAVLDNLHDRLFRELLDIMSENPVRIGTSTCMLLISQKLERIGDHASNIARVVHFSATGRHMADEDIRPFIPAETL